jgi:chemotaxis-related protein WspB
MLLIMCHAGVDRYAIESRHVAEVVPQVTLQRPKGLPSRLAGLMVYHGATMFIIDLTQLTRGVPCPNRLNSRIIVLRTELDTVDRRFGLLAERVALCEVRGAKEGGAFHLGDPTALGNLCLNAQDVFQLLDPNLLVGEAPSETVFGAAEESR